MIIYLFAMLPSESSELLLTESRDVFNPIFCFVLAPNKDLAVSFLHCCKTIPQGNARPFGRSRFCSHLASYDGRPLAAIILSLTCVRDGVRTFLSLKEQSLILLRHLYTNKLSPFVKIIALFKGICKNILTV